MYRGQLPYPPSFYGLTDLRDDYRPSHVAEFLLISYNEYELKSAKGFLDMAWGKVGEEEFNRAGDDHERIRPIVMKDFDFQNEMFKGESRGPRMVRWYNLMSSLNVTRPRYAKMLQLVKWKTCEAKLPHH
jgi:hypothetical protein